MAQSGEVSTLGSGSGHDLRVLRSSPAAPGSVLSKESACPSPSPCLCACAQVKILLKKKKML